MTDYPSAAWAWWDKLRNSLSQNNPTLPNQDFSIAGLTGNDQSPYADKPHHIGTHNERMRAYFAQRDALQDMPNPSDMDNPWMYWDWDAMSVQLRDDPDMQNEVWKTPYMPSYWEHPYNVVRAYNQLKNSDAAGVEGFPWIDRDAVEQAYDYFSYANKDKHWTEWQFLNERDPARQYLQGLQTPPPELALDPNDYNNWVLAELTDKDPAKWDPQVLAQLPEDYRNYLDQIRLQTPFEELPPWQKTTINTMNSPWFSAGMGALPFAIGGLAVAGLPGAVVGGGIGTLAGLEAHRNPQGAVANGLMWLDYPAEWAEQALGVSAQALGALVNPEVYGDFDEVMGNLGAAREAATLTYASGAPFSYENLGSGPRVDSYVYPMKRLDPTNILPLLQWAGDLFDPEKKPEFSGPQEAWILGRAEPVQLDTVGVATLVQARRRIMAGENADQVIADISAQFGFSGEFAELAGHMVGDPLNLMPAVTTKGVGAAARLAGNPKLATAMNLSPSGPVQGLRIYRNLLQSMPVGQLDEISGLTRLMGGLTENNTIRKIDPNIERPGGILKPFNWLFSMTDDAKARMFTGMGSDNTALMLDRYRGNPEAQVQGFGTWANISPHEAASHAGTFFDTPIAYTVQRQVADFHPTAQKMLLEYESVEPQRVWLRETAEKLDMTDGELLKAIRDDSPVIKDRLNNAGVDPEEMVPVRDAFTGKGKVAYSPDEFQADLFNGYKTHAGKWSAEKFGVKEPHAIFRFADTLKKGQGLLLLGFNPSYFVNNVINNEITRLATGVSGYASPGKILNYFEALGMEPHRLGAGVGAADIGIDTPTKVPGTGDTATARRIGAGAAEVGEKEIRKAVNIPRSRFGAGVNKLLDGANRLGVAAQGSQIMERLSGMNATYHGIKRSLAQLMEPGVGFPKMRPELEAALGPDVTRKIYSAASGSMNMDEFMRTMDTEARVYNVQAYANDIANDMNMDPISVRDILSDVDINEDLGSLKGPRDVDRVKSAIKERYQKKHESLTAQDLQTRVDEYATRTEASGGAEGLLLMDEVFVQGEKLHISENRKNGQAFADADAIKRVGGSGKKVSRIWENRMADAKKNHNTWRARSKAATLGVLEGLGADDAFRNRYGNLMDKTGDAWDGFFAKKTSDFREFYSAKHKNFEAQNAAWKRMEAQHNRLYNKTNNQVRKIQKNIDNTFVQLVNEQFGPEAAQAANNWRTLARQLDDQRAEIVSRFRDSMIDMTEAQRRSAWEPFWNEEYFPVIAESFATRRAAIADLRRVLEGKQPFLEPVIERPPVDPSGIGPDQLRMGAHQPNLFEQRNVVPDTDAPIPPAPEAPAPAQPDLGAAPAGPDAPAPVRPEDFPPLTADNLVEFLGPLKERPRHELHPKINELVESVAHTLQDELNSGKGTSIRDDRTRISHNVEWYQEIYDEGYTNRKTVEAAIQRVIDDKGKDKVDLKYVDRIRDLIYDRIVAEAESDPRYLSSLYEDRGPMGPMGFTEDELLGMLDNQKRRLENPAAPDDEVADAIANIQELEAELATLRESIVETPPADVAPQPEPAPTPDIVPPAADIVPPGPVNVYELPLAQMDTGSVLDEFASLGFARGKRGVVSAVNKDLGLTGADKLTWENITYQQALDSVNARIPDIENRSKNQIANKLREDIDEPDFDAEVEARPDETPADVDDQVSAIPAPEAELPPIQGDADPVIREHMPGALDDIAPVQHLDELEADYFDTHVDPVLDALFDRIIDDPDTVGIGGTVMDDATAKMFDRWVNQYKDGMTQSKLAAVNVGQGLRDQALLNYSQRYGGDRIAQLGYPYQFWFTRSAFEWAMRAIDRPAWFANYARIRNFMQNKVSSPGFPSRLANRMSIPAPFLPEWAGDSIWVDPMRKVFPIEEFLGPYDRYAQDQAANERQIEFELSRMMQDGRITRQEYQDAVAFAEGPAWEEAVTAVNLQLESEGRNPQGLFEMLMSPALWWSIPGAALKGEDPGILPITRSGRAFREVTKDTPLELIGSVVGAALAKPEDAYRDMMGLHEFGEWGPYYIDKNLSNMVGEGVPYEDVLLAMIERQGPIWDEAVGRVEYELALRTPGVASVEAIKDLPNANLGNAHEYAQAMLFGILPSGLLPEGELELRGLAQEYGRAFDQYNAGDTEALEEFWDDHPEYVARTALFAEPEERLRQFLISQVYDQYTDLGSLEQQTVRQQFGPLFSDTFLPGDRQVHDALDLETLARWSQMLGGPKVESDLLPGMEDFKVPELRQAPPEDAAILNGYREQRAELFPNWFALQDRYFNLPRNQRRDYLNRFPELAEYWDWSREQKSLYPQIQEYTASPNIPDPGPDTTFLANMDRNLMRQILGQLYAGQPLTSGGIAALEAFWESSGRPAGSPEQFLETIIAPAFGAP